MSSATRPNFISLPSLKADKEAERKGASDEERSLYAMSRSGGWKVFSALASQAIKELDEINTKAIESGASYEELGRNTLVISLTKDIIGRLMNKVEDAKESCESGDTGDE